MNAQIRSSSGDHLKYLDASRGIAAVMVLAYHFIGWRFHDKPEVRWANLIFNGSDAVSFFFVLSGFVLSYKPVVYGQQISVPRFYVARLFRLLPGFVVTVCLLALYWQQEKINWDIIADEFLYNKNRLWEELFLLRDQPRVYFPGWTLQIELAISFFVPFIVLMVRNNRKVLPWLLLCVLLEGHLLINNFHLHFILGVALSCYYNDLRSESIKQRAIYRYRYLLLIGALLLFSIRHIDSISPLGPSYKYLASYLGLDFFMYTGLSSCIIIAWLITSNRVQCMLTHPGLLFIGKISYGIYLSHWIVISYIYSHWNELKSYMPAGGKLSFVLLGLLAFAGTVTMATIMYYIVELPFIRLGKKLAGRIKPGLVIQ